MAITVPKYMRELHSFIGIKSGIILEGNVYDEFPIFEYKDGIPEPDGIDNLNFMIQSLTNEETTDTVFLIR